MESTGTSHLVQWFSNFLYCVPPEKILSSLSTTSEALTSFNSLLLVQDGLLLAVTTATQQKLLY